MKKFTLLAILGLLLGIASPLPIWPGPLLVRHLPPGIISAALVIFACFGTMKEGSKAVGVIAIIYGALASLSGILIFYIATGTSPEFLAGRGSIVVAGSVLAIFIGIMTILLGIKSIRKGIKS
jgi:FtsH-binding integral membrane protein